VRKTQLRSVSKFVSALCAMPQLGILLLRTITVRKKKIQQTFIVFLRATFGCVKQRNHESLCGFFGHSHAPKKIMLQNKNIILIKIKITINVFFIKINMVGW
jgi:hypothetical protein